MGALHRHSAHCPVFSPKTTHTAMTHATNDTNATQVPTKVPSPISPAPSVASVQGHGNPHFEWLGGEPVIRQLVDRFYVHMDTLPQTMALRAMHPADLGPVKRVLVNYLIEWTGGPQRYSVERGHPRLRRKHQAFAIGPAERDAWMDCMRLALDEVVTDPSLKDQLTQAFLKTADFLRNDAAHHHHLPSG
jgi:hemoglobin